jgi:hypothetical protein
MPAVDLPSQVQMNALEALANPVNQVDRTDQAGPVVRGVPENLQGLVAPVVLTVPKAPADLDLPDPVPEALVGPGAQVVAVPVRGEDRVAAANDRF